MNEATNIEGGAPPGMKGRRGRHALSSPGHTRNETIVSEEEEDKNKEIETNSADWAWY